MHYVLRWVPFEVAKPLLDKKPYAVLSDFTKASLSPAPQASETLVESTSEREDMEMNNSDEDSDSDSSVNGSDIANILISLNGAKLRYKVISVLLVHNSAPVSYPDDQVLNLS